MEVILALAIGVLAGSGVWLLLRPRTYQVIIGLSLISYAVNLFIFCMGRLRSGVPPVLASAGIGDPSQYTDPVPQASVSPAPRSYTRSFTSRRLITCRKPAFTRRGNASWFSTSGPTMATGAWSTSLTRCTACGLPIDSTATSAVMPSPRSSGQRA